MVRAALDPRRRSDCSSNSAIAADSGTALAHRSLAASLPTCSLRGVESLSTLAYDNLPVSYLSYCKLDCKYCKLVLTYCTGMRLTLILDFVHYFSASSSLLAASLVHERVSQP